MTQYQNAYMPWLAILICVISSSKVCDWETNLPHYWLCSRSKHTILYNLISDSPAIMMMLRLKWQVVLLMLGSSRSVSEEFTIFAIFRSPSCSMQHWGSWSLRQRDQWYYYRVIHKCSKRLQQTEGIGPRWKCSCYLSKLEENKYQASTESRKCDMVCLSLDSNNIESMRLRTKADHKSWT